MTSSPIGTYALHKSSAGNEANVLLTFDWSTRHEVALGATISGTPTAAVTLNDAASTHITLSSLAVDTAKKLFQLRITDAGAVVGNQYHVVCVASFSDGTGPLTEYILVTAEQA